MSLPKNFGKPTRDESTRDESNDSCLKFNKKSWHYKLMDYLWQWKFEIEAEQKRISLCKYFWSVVTGIFLYPFVRFWRSLPYSIRDHQDLAYALVLWAFICLGVHLGFWLSDPELWWVGVSVYFGGIGAGLFVAGIIIGLMKLNDMRRERRRAQGYKPSLFKEFIKAKKSRVCPCLEFVDDGT